MDSLWLPSLLKFLLFFSRVLNGYRNLVICPHVLLTMVSLVKSKNYGWTHYHISLTYYQRCWDDYCLSILISAQSILPEYFYLSTFYLHNFYRNYHLFWSFPRACGRIHVQAVPWSIWWDKAWWLLYVEWEIKLQDEWLLMFSA